MNRGFRHSFTKAAIGLAFTIIATFIANSSIARAVLIIQNNTACPVDICATTTGGATYCATIPAKTQGRIAVSCPLPVVSITVCSLTRTVPPGGCLTNLLLPGGCCADVCFDNGPACALTVNPVAGPCSC